jgi:hypothetical protein
VPTERRIANRESRPNRIYGLTWGEIFGTIVPTVIVIATRPTFYVGVLLLIVDYVVVFSLSRRFPPGAVHDWLDGQAALLRHGQRRYEPRLTDPELRAGAGFLREAP